MSVPDDTDFATSTLQLQNAMPHVLSTPASSWSQPQLRFLRVTQYSMHELPEWLSRYYNPLPDEFKTELETFTSGMELLKCPRRDLPTRSRLYSFFSCLAGVLQRPSPQIELSREPPEQLRQRVATSYMEGFISGEHMGLSSSPRSELSSSGESMHNEPTSLPNKKNEMLTVAMAGNFINDVVIFGQGPLDTAVEFSAGQDRVFVEGRGWNYVTVDDGGLVLKRFFEGQWTVGNRVVGMECKGDYDVMDDGALGQYVAEMLGRAFVQRNDNWGEGLDRRRVFLLCFSENMFEMKWVEFSEETLHELFAHDDDDDDDEDDDAVFPVAQLSEASRIDLYSYQPQDLATAHGRVTGAMMIQAVVAYYSKLFVSKK